MRPQGDADAYINAESLQLPHDAHYLALRMDTWYFCEAEEVGSLDLGEAPIVGSAAVAEQLARNVASVSHAFADLAHVQGISVYYRPALDAPAVHKFYFPPMTTDTLARAVETRLAQRPCFVTALDVSLNLEVTLRDHRGALTAATLPGAASVYFAAQWASRSTPYLVMPQPIPSARQGSAPWTATLSLDVASLFRQTNAAVLDEVRAEWQHARSGGTEADGIVGAHECCAVVTLARTPAGTPPDNRELAERNAPRLESAVARWASGLRASFAWQTPLA
jgi:hypothetical protein